MQIKTVLKSQERMQRKKASKTFQETVLFLNCKPKCRRDQFKTFYSQHFAFATFETSFHLKTNF